MDSGIFTIVIVAASVLFGLVITGVSLFFFWRVFQSFNKSMQDSAQLLATGVPAQGRVLAVHDLGGSIQIMGQMPQHRLKIDLEVQPSTGQPPFMASATQLVSMLAVPRIQPGATVQVRFDPTNPLRVAVAL